MTFRSNLNSLVALEYEFIVLVYCSEKLLGTLIKSNKDTQASSHTHTHRHKQAHIDGHGLLGHGVSVPGCAAEVLLSSQLAEITAGNNVSAGRAWTGPGWGPTVPLKGSYCPAPPPSGIINYGPRSTALRPIKSPSKKHSQQACLPSPLLH